MERRLVKKYSQLPEELVRFTVKTNSKHADFILGFLTEAELLDEFNDEGKRLVKQMATLIEQNDTEDEEEQTNGETFNLTSPEKAQLSADYRATLEMLQAAFPDIPGNEIIRRIQHFRGDVNKITDELLSYEQLGTIVASEEKDIKLHADVEQISMLTGLNVDTILPYYFESQRCVAKTLILLVNYAILYPHRRVLPWDEAKNRFQSQKHFNNYEKDALAFYNTEKEKPGRSFAHLENLCEIYPDLQKISYTFLVKTYLFCFLEVESLLQFVGVIIQEKFTEETFLRPLITSEYVPKFNEQPSKDSQFQKVGGKHSFSQSQAATAPSLYSPFSVNDSGLTAREKYQTAVMAKKLYAYTRRIDPSGVPKEYQRTLQHMSKLSPSSVQNVNESYITRQIDQLITEALQSYRLDFHSVQYHHAQIITRKLLPRWWENEKQKQAADETYSIHPLSLMTGVGLHSSSGKARIKPMITKYLRANNYKFYETNNGGITHVAGKLA